MKENSKVAIVNRRFAEHFFKGGSAVGKHLGRGGGPKTKLDIEIIGVVADSLYEGPREGVRRQVFVPNWGKNSAVFYVRTQTASAGAYSLMRNEVKQLDAAMPVYSMKTLEAQLDETLLTDRLIALLSAGFGLLATLLASIGLYGVMAFVVARRQEGARHPPRARRAAGAGDLAGDEGGAGAAGDRPGDRRAGGASALGTLRFVAALWHRQPRSRRRDPRRSSCSRWCRPPPA